MFRVALCFVITGVTSTQMPSPNIAFSIVLPMEIEHVPFQIQGARSRLTAFAFLISALLVSPIKAQEPTDVTLVRLIANPEKFDGKLIRVSFMGMDGDSSLGRYHLAKYRHFTHH